jgi:TPR repeat protein
MSVKRNYKIAVNWFLKASIQGFTRAHINLSVAYAHGQGVSRNYVRAFAWADAGAKLAKQPQQRKKLIRLREKAAQKLSPDQQSVAKRLAAELYQSHKPKN